MLPIIECADMPRRADMLLFPLHVVWKWLRSLVTRLFTVHEPYARRRDISEVLASLCNASNSTERYSMEVKCAPFCKQLLEFAKYVFCHQHSSISSWKRHAINPGELRHLSLDETAEFSVASVSQTTSLLWFLPPSPFGCLLPQTANHKRRRRLPCLLFRGTISSSSDKHYFWKHDQLIFAYSAVWLHCRAPDTPRFPVAYAGRHLYSRSVLSPLFNGSCYEKHTGRPTWAEITDACHIWFHGKTGISLLLLAVKLTSRSAVTIVPLPTGNDTDFWISLTQTTLGSTRTYRGDISTPHRHDIDPHVAMISTPRRLDINPTSPWCRPPRRHDIDPTSPWYRRPHRHDIDAHTAMISTLKSPWFRPHVAMISTPMPPWYRPPRRHDSDPTSPWYRPSSLRDIDPHVAMISTLKSPWFRPHVAMISTPTSPWYRPPTSPWYRPPSLHDIDPQVSMISTPCRHDIDPHVAMISTPRHRDTCAQVNVIMNYMAQWYLHHKTPDIEGHVTKLAIGVHVTMISTYGLLLYWLTGHHNIEVQIKYITMISSFGLPLYPHIFHHDVHQSHHDIDAYYVSPWYRRRPTT